MVLTLAILMRFDVSGRIRGSNISWIVEISETSLTRETRSHSSSTNHGWLYFHCRSMACWTEWKPPSSGIFQILIAEKV